VLGRKETAKLPEEAEEDESAIDWDTGLDEIKPAANTIQLEIEWDLLRLYEPWLVSSMDDTSWKLINMNIKTIVERGADGVTHWFPGDPKYCATAIATVDAAGEKKPLWITTKGLTDRRE
jgi:hypothetical protein